MKFSPEGRRDFLNEQCAGDQALLDEVRRLLDADADADTLVNNLVFNVKRSETFDLRPGETVGHYLIQRLLGRGGMAIVYEAVDTRLNRSVALKFLTPESREIETVRSRFLQEARAVSALDHPHICTVYDVGETSDGEMYIAMALCDGEDLAKILSRGPLPLARALDVAIKIADALTAAHSQGIVHRDVKPANIIVSDDGVKLLDFGIAKVSGRQITGQGELVGTPAYMSPEQLNGGFVDARADIWALGLILYEMVSGQKPFSTSSIEVLMYQIMAKTPAPLADVPETLNALLARALERDDDQRYQRMADLKADLERIRRPANRALLTTDDVRRGTAERRLITVVQCGLVSSMPGLDPERLLDVLPSFRALVARIVTRLDGTVFTAISDYVVAFFGVPTAHEDDARRAVRVALALVDAVADKSEFTDAGFAVRAGIHAGTMIARSPQTNVTVDLTSMVGRVPRIAGALEALAAPGEVVVTRTVKNLLGESFAFEESTARRLPGEAEPVAVYRALGESAGPEAVVPLVGRQQEVALLRQRWALARDGAGQGVVIVGEAGIGKSRLVQVLREFALEGGAGADGQSGGAGVWRIECQCSPYHRNVAFYPIIDLFERAIFKFAPDDDEPARLARIEAFLSENDQVVEETAPLLGMLLGLAVSTRYPPLQLSPERAREKTMDLLLRLMLARAEIQPVIFIVEDLHWSDPSFIEFIGRLLTQLPTARIFAVLTHRPEFQADWTRGMHVSDLRLLGLPTAEVRQLVEALPGASRLAPEQIDSLATNADGVPLFAEELAKSMLDTGSLENSTVDRVVPATLQESLTARLDRLGRVKGIAQLASMFGREFSFRLLSAIATRDEASMKRGLDKLVRAGLLFVKGIEPHVVYIFKHALIQEAAYQSLLIRDRQRYHGQIADALSSELSDVAEGQPQVLAHHLHFAARYVEAIPLWLQAGGQAQRRSAHQEAVGQYDEAMNALRQIPSGANRDALELSIRAAMGPALMAIKGYSSADVETAYGRALTLSQQSTDASQKVSVLAGLWAYYVVRGELGTAKDLAQQFLQIVNTKGAEDLMIQGHTLSGVTLFHTGDIDEARHHFEAEIASYDLDQHKNQAYLYGQDPDMACRSYLASVLWWQGLPDQAIRMSESAIERAQQVGHAFSEAFALYIAARLRFQLKTYDVLFELTDRCVAVSSKYGFPIWQALATMIRGQAMVATGDVDAGIALVDKTLGAYQARGAGLSLPYYLGLYADALERHHRLDESKGAMRQALDAAHRQGAHTERAELLRIQAILSWRRGEFEAAERGLKAALELAEA
ncbi:MAG: protein kinase, partial [Myxococcota bacterium]